MGKINWRFQDEVGSNLNRYKLTDVATNEEKTYDLLRNANITTQGTPLNASNLNALISTINENFDSTTLMYQISQTSSENGVKKAFLYLAKNNSNIIHNKPYTLFMTGYAGPSSNYGFSFRKTAEYPNEVIYLQSFANKYIYKYIIPKDTSTLTINDITYTTETIVTTPIEWKYVSLDYPETASLTLDINSTYEYRFHTGAQEELCGIFSINNYASGTYKSPVYYVNKPYGSGIDKLMLVYKGIDKTIEAVNAETGARFSEYQDTCSFAYRKIF